MAPEIVAERNAIEGQYMTLQPTVEKMALDLRATDPDLMTEFLTDYSVTHGESMVHRWRQLGEHLLTKYNDGYVKNDKGRPKMVGYPEAWKKRVVDERPEQFKLPQEKSANEAKLTD